MKKTFRIATRQSPLAIAQAELIQTRLQQQCPLYDFVLVSMTTSGDRFLDKNLFEIGGKGLFVKELEQALLDHQADLAVHSMKDVPMQFPEGLGIVAITERENPFDTFISRESLSIDQLPSGARIGTASLRRQCQLRALRSDIVIEDLRGNVNTRLEKLHRHQFDAIVLAVAGLKRLHLEQHIQSILSPDICLPAVGQGALGIECRLDDAETRQIVSVLNDIVTERCVLAERAVNQVLDGGCHAPIAAFAEITQQSIYLRARVGAIDGSVILQAEKKGSAEQFEMIGQEVAKELLQKGAKKILQPFCHPGQAR